MLHFSVVVSHLLTIKKKNKKTKCMVSFKVPIWTLVPGNSLHNNLFWVTLGRVRSLALMESLSAILQLSNDNLVRVSGVRGKADSRQDKFSNPFSLWRYLTFYSPGLLSSKNMSWLLVSGKENAVCRLLRHRTQIIRSQLVPGLLIIRVLFLRSSVHSQKQGTFL